MNHDDRILDCGNIQIEVLPPLDQSTGQSGYLPATEENCNISLERVRHYRVSKDAVVDCEEYGSIIDQGHVTDGLGRLWDDGGNTLHGAPYVSSANPQRDGDVCPDDAKPKDEEHRIRYLARVPDCSHSQEKQHRGGNLREQKADADAELQGIAVFNRCNCIWVQPCDVAKE